MNGTDFLPMPSVDGILVIDKPKGLTSHDVVAQVRKILKTRRVGHTGTLDPFATGVLVVCVNRATRLVQFLTGTDKEYLATMRLGYATDTGDLTGKPISPLSDTRHVGIERVEEVLKEFLGLIRQTPPMYSAKKVGGVKLYERARRGEVIRRDPIEVRIKELELCGPGKFFEDSTQEILFRVVCSSGTYVRTLAEDMGSRLEVGAHLTALRRTRVGTYDLDRAWTLDRLAQSGESGVAWISMTDALPFQGIVLGSEERSLIVHGRSIRRDGYWQNGERAKLLSPDGELIAIANFDGEKLVWRPTVVLAQ